MTTDTYPKTAVIKKKINNKQIKIYGIAKGSGMVCPNMGTMLVYIFIEAKLTKSNLKYLIDQNLEQTFNSISVDGDTSTSDTLSIFSIDKNTIDFKNKKNREILNQGIATIMKDLALKVVKDGEGITKLVKANVSGAKSIKQSKNIALSIINSPLVKTAISGEDANWGRIIMAIGKTKEKINQNKLIISFGKYIVCKFGSINQKIKIKELNKYMKNHLIEINVNLNNGNYSSTVYGNDLSYEYIRINADYRS